ncbi:MAG: secretin and TonB N-terminal domain-containing protein [Deltaproteobacteria bacterium]|nr:secretin and TonB N-terminal domain-containing protein [Deltaproteobacteria bacterium]
MKPEKRIFSFVLSFLIGLLLLSGCTTIGSKPSAGVSSAQEKAEGNTGGAYIKGVILKEMKGKEQVSILLSDVPDFSISRESDNALVINLMGVSIPEGMKKEYSGGKLKNLKTISLHQETTEGKEGAFVRVLLKRMVPYRYSKDGSRVIVDFDVSTLSYKTPSAARYSPDPHPAPAPKTIKITHGKVNPQPEKNKQYTGKKISLDFQDADIKSVFRLISEISGFSIVAGPDVKAEVTVHMKDVPWDQALDTILEINGLGKRQSGTVISVLPLKELKKINEEQRKKIPKDKIKQITIEAKIVEVSTNFAREMGIKWGYGYKDRWGEKDYGVMIGNSASGDLTTLPGGIGLTSSNTAVNFPSAVAAAVPAIGLVMGTSKFILDAKLSALENTGDGKIISSPKVTTLDGVKATIKQGEEIPYTVVEEDGKTSTEFKEATLKLEVTPTVTPEGRISIEVKANNDYADWTYKNPKVVSDNPPIKTSSVESTVVVADGDTIVIGGVYKTIASESVEGVPLLSNIPVLGWLFKYKTVSNDKRELLIFVTPRIIREEG